MRKPAPMIVDPKMMYRVEGWTIESDPQLVYRFESPDLETIRAFQRIYEDDNSIIKVTIWKVKTMKNGYRTLSAYNLEEH